MVVSSLGVVSRSVRLVLVNRWVILVVLVNRGVSAVKGEVASAGGTTRYLGGPSVIHVKREWRGVEVLRSPPRPLGGPPFVIHVKREWGGVEVLRSPPRPLGGLGMVRVRCGESGWHVGLV